MRKIHFVLLVITLVFLAQLLFFYRGVYFSPPTNEPDFLGIKVNSSIPIEIHENFTKSSGTVLIDLSHGNNFDVRELNLLVSRIIARGYNVEYLRDNSNMNKNLSYSTSLVVISPASSFSTADVRSIKGFIDIGGRLLMFSDSENSSEINSLASEFGILFWNDYLYNLKENDGNFKYIYLTEFTENNITRGLQKIVFFTSSSVYGNGIIFSNNDTYSSTRGEKGRYSVAVMTENSQVVAIGDMTFLSEPYNVLDNNRLIYNIADFLTMPAATAKPLEIIPTTANNSNLNLSAAETG